MFYKKRLEFNRFTPRQPDISDAEFVYEPNADSYSRVVEEYYVKLQGRKDVREARIAQTVE